MATTTNQRLDAHKAIIRATNSSSFSIKSAGEKALKSITSGSMADSEIVKWASREINHRKMFGE